MKRLIISLLILCMLSALLPLRVSAEVLSGVCGDGLTYSLDLGTKTLTISGVGAMDDFGDSGEPVQRSDDANAWYRYQKDIKTVVVEEGVTTIGYKAFTRFSALTRVELPESVTKIGQSAFEECAALPEIRLPSKLQQLSKNAFMKCSSLQTLTLPSTLTGFSAEVVWYCTSLTAINVAEGSSAYASQNGVLFSKDGSVLVCYPCGKPGESYTVPAEVREIEDRAFYGAKLRQISLPEGLTGLGGWAFALSGLTEFTLPNAFSAVPESLLNGCAALEKVTLHDGVTEIGQLAFAYCPALAEIQLPEGLQSIGYYAFMGCASLSELTLPEGLSALESHAFAGTGISSVTIPEGITALDNGLFSGCKNLTEVKLHENVTSLGADLFRDCTALESISLPNSVKTISRKCFSGTGLKEFVFPEAVTEASIGVFENCAALREVDCANVREIDMNAFGNCTALESIRFGSELLVIDWAFSGCENLRDVYYANDQEHWRTVNVTKTGNDPLLQAQLHFSEGTPPRFTDVKPNAYYADAVVWAVKNGIAKGTKSGTFNPGGECTRADAVTFLWRAAGQSEAKVANPFVDVRETAYYYKAMLWAVENGITKGIDKTHFAPGKPCTRAQIVTFLWRAAGQPSVGSDPQIAPQNPFTDVKSGSFYRNAVLWAVENGVTKGMTETTFEPDTVCTRAQIVTFLYRGQNGGE